MNTSTCGKSGARLPLMLLLGFIVLVTGIAVWLTFSYSDPDVTSDASIENNTAVAELKSRDKQAAERRSRPNANPEEKPDEKHRHYDTKRSKKRVRDAQKGVRKPSHKGESDYSPKTPRKSDSLEPTTTKSPTETAKTHLQTPPATSPRQPKKTKKKPPRNPTSARALLPKILTTGPRDAPLSSSPDPALLDMTPIGPLPRVGDDGRLPRQVYAKPFNIADSRPRVAIVVSGLGLSAAATESAIQGLPGSVTLAFAPYSPRLNEWIDLARAAGHEVMINIPMEPTNYPAYDPGPQTLLTTLNSERNLDRLFWSLSRGTSYVGVVDFLGSQFTTSLGHMTPILDAINRRGLIYLDSNSSPRSVSLAVASKLNMVSAKATLTLDKRASRTEIDRRFAELEQRAKRDLRAIGIASPYPVSLERIATWVRQLEARGVSIAPVSALAQTPKLSRAPQ